MTRPPQFCMLLLVVALAAIPACAPTASAASAASAAASRSAARPPEKVKYFIQLVWGTNREKPAHARFRPVGAKLRKQLRPVFQWKNYWEVNRQTMLVRPGHPSKLRLSKECEVEIAFVSPTQRETRIIGNGVLVASVRQRIHCRRPSIQGGATRSGGSWFVVVREDPPPD